MDLLSNLSQMGKLCSGCGACNSVCPTKAINMMPDSEGFYYPNVDEAKCVDCGKCERTCPVLTPRYVNDAPECYAMMAPDELRIPAASGGFVSAVAKWILDMNGVVYGAVWTDDWNACHMEAETWEDFEKIRNSKYIQGQTGDSIKSAIERLKKGQYVLYTGLPCQIAAFYACLGDSPVDKLYTIDVLCHGTPSEKVLKKYLRDTYGDKKIRKIDFREKTTLGWTSSINIYFEDGTEVHKSAREDSFYQAFLPCMDLRPSCAQCQFSRLPRQADFTCGDFWGVKRELNDNKGTSFALTNNQRAREFMAAHSAELKLWEPATLDEITKINKTLIFPYPAHPGRKHFFSILDQKPFKQAVEASLNHHYDIGVVGLWYGINYGSVLTYYALYSLLRDLGKDPVMLPKPNGMWEEVFNQPDSIAQKFIWKYCNVFVPFNQKEEYSRVNDLCDDFVLGSDVVWNYDICGRASDQFFFMDWVEPGHRKIAYAASMGQKLKGPDEYVQQAIYNLNQFDALSCRENSGVTQLQSLVTDSQVAHVLDPVFVCNPRIYEEIIKDVPRVEGGSVFGYFLREAGAKERLRMLQYAAQYFGAEKTIISLNPNPLENSKTFFRLYGEKARNDLSVEEWVSSIRNSKFYAGDSYHGLCFALIFHVPFAIIYLNTVRDFSRARFDSLLEAVGLQDRIIDELDNFDEKMERIITSEIDWDDVNERLSSWKEESAKWLKDALEKQPREASPENYVRMAEKRKANEQIVSLTEQNRQLATRVDTLHENADGLHRELAGVHEELSRTRCELAATYQELGVLRQDFGDYRQRGFFRWIGRKTRGGIQCLLDNGLKYTCVHFWKKVCNKLGNKV